MSETLLARKISTPIETVLAVVSSTGLRALMWPKDADEAPRGVSGHEVRGDEGRSLLLDEVQRQLEEYFAGSRRDFDVPLDPVGTEFQREAWRVLSGIPFGTTISYADQARALGDVRKARAVGGANGRNPIPIIVPCHRVIGTDGSLTGFAIGTEVKKYLLDFERTRIANG